MTVAQADPESTPVAPRRSRFRVAAEWIGVSITVFSALTYAALHAAYGEFFRTFGLVPEDVGIGFSQVLATTLSAILVAFVGFALFWLWLLIPLVLALVLPLRKRDESETRLRRLRGAALELVALAGACLLVGAAAESIWTNSSTPHELKLIAWLLVAALVALAGIRLLFRPSFEQLRSREDWRALLAVAVAAGVVCSIWTTYHATRALARRDTHRAFAGYPVSSPRIDLPADFLDPPAFDIRASAARVLWSQRRPENVKPTDCLLFLGGAGEISYLFNARTRETLRVAPFAVAIGSKRARANCKNSSTNPKS